MKDQSDTAAPEGGEDCHICGNPLSDKGSWFCSDVHLNRPTGNPRKTKLRWDDPKFYPVRCAKCLWEGMSDEAKGGEPIADSGDYGDICCPRCFKEREEFSSLEDIPEPPSGQETGTETKAEKKRRLNRESNARNYAKRKDYEKTRDRQKVLARNLVRRQVHRGKMVKGPCEVCGDPNTDGHHDDYSKPREVRWLCRAHHKEHHMKEDQITKLKSELTAAREENASWNREVQSVIDHMPKDCVIRCREGGGPESLAGTLALSVMKLMMAREDSAKEIARQQETIRKMREALEEISRDAWSGEKSRMNSIGRNADSALALADGKGGGDDA